MKLTCVTAVFNAVAAGNRERLIRCVKSVAALKTEHEHLVYDGASTDGTVELLRELEAQTSGLKVVSEKDTGIYNALNKGVRDASGEWLYVLGCDDFISAPEVLDDVISHRIQSFDHVISPVVWDDGRRKRVGGIYRRNIFFGTPYCHQGVLTRTQVVRSCGGFGEKRRVFADYALFAEIHRRAVRIAYLTKPFSTYYAEGMSAVGHGVFPDETMSVSKELLGVSDEDVRRFKRKLYFPLKPFLPMLFHRDATFRYAALYMVLRNIAGHFGYFNYKRGERI